MPKSLVMGPNHLKGNGSWWKPRLSNRAGTWPALSVQTSNLDQQTGPTICGVAASLASVILTLFSWIHPEFSWQLFIDFVFFYLLILTGGFLHLLSELCYCYFIVEVFQWGFHFTYQILVLPFLLVFSLIFSYILCLIDYSIISFSSSFTVQL